MTPRTYDIFITHAWRYHDDWTKAGELLDSWRELSWRNFSVPWHDPAMDPNTEIGGKFVSNWLESQIIPVHAVLALDSVFAVRSARRWIGLEIEFARRHAKPVFALPAHGHTEISTELAGLVDETVAWDAHSIIGQIDAALRRAAGA